MENRSGIFKFYYPEGKVKAVVNQLDSGKISYTKNYHPNGNLMAAGKYVNQKKDSTWLYYSEEEGKLSLEEHYVNTSGREYGRLIILKARWLKKLFTRMA